MFIKSNLLYNDRFVAYGLNFVLKNFFILRRNPAPVFFMDDRAKRSLFFFAA